MRYLAAIVVILFCTGFWICSFVYPNHINGGEDLIKWWDLRISIYSTIFALCFFIGYRLTKGFTKAIFLVGVVFCMGDILDRSLFDINRFHVNDLLLYLFAIIYLPNAYAREIKGDS